MKKAGFKSKFICLQSPCSPSLPHAASQEVIYLILEAWSISKDGAMGKCEPSWLMLTRVDSRDSWSTPCSTASSHVTQLVRTTVTGEVGLRPSPLVIHVLQTRWSGKDAPGRTAHHWAASTVTASHRTPSRLSSGEGAPGHNSADGKTNTKDTGIRHMRIFVCLLQLSWYKLCHTF